MLTFRSEQGKNEGTVGDGMEKSLIILTAVLLVLLAIVTIDALWGEGKHE